MNDHPQNAGGAAPTGHQPPPPQPSNPMANAPAAPELPSAAELSASALGLLRGLGPRAERRGTPRLSVLISVAGAVVAAIGILLTTGIGEVPVAVGVLMWVALIGAGAALVWIFRRGPLAAAGATASGLSLFAVLVELLVDDIRPTFGNFVSVVVLSSVGWIALYLVGPGRGHTVYAALTTTSIGLMFVALISEDTQNFFEQGPSTIWGFILVGSVWCALGYLLDRQGMAGLATAFVGPGAAFLVFSVVGVVTYSLSIGVSELNFVGSATARSSSDLPQLILPGLALVVAGLFALRYGAAALRRATSWTGCALLAGGLWAFLVGLLGSNATLLAVATMVVGVALAYGGYELGRRLNEADELGETPSFATVGLVQALKDSLPVKTADPEVFRTFGGVAWVSPVAAAPVHGADGPQGPGWWIASDGKWYPPQPPASPTATPAAPAAPATPAAPPAAPSAPAATPPPAAAPASQLADLPPAPGWWKASDGNWYPPQDT